MKNSWRVILTSSQNSLGKQFRNDLMMLRGYCTPSKKTNKQNKTKINKNKQKQKQKNKQNKTKQKQKTHTQKKCFVLYLKININAFLKNNLIVIVRPRNSKIASKFK